MRVDPLPRSHPHRQPQRDLLDGGGLPPRCQRARRVLPQRPHRFVALCGLALLLFLSPLHARTGTEGELQEPLELLQEFLGQLEPSREDNTDEILEVALEALAEVQSPGIVASLMNTLLAIGSADLTDEHKLTFWRAALDRAREIDSADDVHRLISARYMDPRGKEALPQDLQLFRQLMGEFPGPTASSPYVRYGEAFAWKGLDNAYALNVLAILQEEIHSAPDLLAGLQTNHDLLKGTIELMMGRASQAHELLRTQISPWLDRGEPVEFEVIRQWIEYLLSAKRHQEAIELIGRVLDSRDELRLQPVDLHRLLARRGTARAEFVFDGRGDPDAVMADLRTALEYEGLTNRPWDQPADATWRLAALSLLSLQRHFQDREGFLATLELADAHMGPGARRINQLRLELFRAHGDLLTEASQETLHGRLASLESHWQAVIEEWRAEPPASIGIGFLQDGDTQDAAHHLMQFAMGIHPGTAGVERALGYVLDTHGVGELVRHADGPSPGLHEVKRAFSRPGRGALVLTTSRKHGHLFCVDARGVEHVHLPGIAPLREAAEEWNRRLTRDIPGTDSEEAAEHFRGERQAARAVSELLFENPIGKRILGWDSLTAIGLDEVVPPAIEWLPLESEPYLGLERSVVKWPSLLAGLLLEQRTPAPTAGPVHQASVLLAGGASHSAAALKLNPNLTAIPLPGEFDSIVRESPGFDEVRVLAGEQLTPAELLAALESTPDVAVFFTHALRDFEGDPERPTVLALSPSPAGERSPTDARSATGFFGARDFDLLSVPAPRFALLAACRTGASKERIGSGIGTDLGSAFLLAGSQIVLTSRVDLHAAPAQAFVEAMLRGIGEGNSPEEAARRARAALVDRHGTRTPYLLHGIQLNGAGSTLLANPKRSGPTPVAMTLEWALGLGGVGALVVIYVIRRARRRRSSDQML